MDWRSRPKIFPIYMKKIRIRVREHSGAIPAKGSASDSDPLGSGSNGLKYWRSDILDSHLVIVADLSLTLHETSHR